MHILIKIWGARSNRPDETEGESSWAAREREQQELRKSGSSKSCAKVKAQSKTKLRAEISSKKQSIS